MWTIFKVFFFLICYNIVSVLAFRHEACGILASQLGLEPTSSALEGELLTTGAPWKAPWSFFAIRFFVNLP